MAAGGGPNSRQPRVRAQRPPAQRAPRYCAACGGDGWLDSLSEPDHPHYNHGNTNCPFCRGTGRDLS